MKRLAWVVLVLSLAVALAGCGQSLGTTIPTAEGYSVFGQVISSEGGGVPGVTLSFGSGVGTAVSSENGSWSKDGLTGEVTITPAKAEWTFDPPAIRVSQRTYGLRFVGSPPPAHVELLDSCVLGMVRLEAIGGMTYYTRHYELWFKLANSGGRTGHFSASLIEKTSGDIILETSTTVAPGQTTPVINVAAPNYPRSTNFDDYNYMSFELLYSSDGCSERIPVRYGGTFLE